MFPESNMLYDGMKDPWERACVIEYLNFLKLRTWSQRNKN